MANVSSSNGLEKRPKLRFPGFDEPWRAEKLSDFAERVTRKNSNNETDLPLTISSKDGLVDQISYFNLNIPRYVDTFEPEPEIDLNEVAAEIRKLQSEIKDIDAELKPFFDELGLDFPFDVEGK